MVKLRQLATPTALSFALSLGGLREEKATISRRELKVSLGCQKFFLKFCILSLGSEKITELNFEMGFPGNQGDNIKTD